MHSMLLQMDVEGWEYNIIINMSRDVLKRFDVLCIEFHQFFSVGYKHGYRLMAEVFNKLLMDFVPVHVHANNSSQIKMIHGITLPDFIEITFYRRDLMREFVKVKSISNKKDAPNLLDKSELKIEDWMTVMKTM